MPRRVVTQLRDVEVDEISLVDVPANQHAMVAIAKRATEEDTVPDKIFDEDGAELGFDSLTEGQVVYDADGEAYVYTEDPVDGDLELDDEPVLAEVGKSLGTSLREELAKSLTGIERDEAIAKALDRVSAAERRAQAAEEVAKAERNLRLEREYVEVAKSYNVPVDADELGPVLMRMADALPDADCAVIHKALSAAGEALFAEVGYVGGADNGPDVMSQVDAAISAAVSKSDQKVSKAAAVEEFFMENPDAYDEYLASQGR